MGTRPFTLTDGARNRAARLHLAKRARHFDKIAAAKPPKRYRQGQAAQNLARKMRALIWANHIKEQRDYYLGIPLPEPHRKDSPHDD